MMDASAHHPRAIHEDFFLLSVDIVINTILPHKDFMATVMYFVPNCGRVKKTSVSVCPL